MTEYTCVISGSTEEFAEKINDLIREGWALQGGMSVSYHAYTDQDGTYVKEDYTFTQAMIRTRP